MDIIEYITQIKEIITLMKHLNQKLNFERDSQYLAKMALYEIYPS